MARRIIVIGCLLALLPLVGCCHKCGHLRERKAYRHGVVLGDPCDCSCSSPIAASPVIMPANPALPAEAYPMTQRMPASGVNLVKPIPAATLQMTPMPVSR